MQRLRTLGARRPLVPFAALSASYFAHIGFFNPYLPLWLKSLGLPLVTIGVLTSLQSLTRLFAPYGWGMFERPYRPACALAALVFYAGAGDFRGPVGARRHLVDCGRAAAHVHPHQRDDADERGRHGPLGEPGRQLRCAPLWPGAAVGLAGLSGHGVCGRGVV